MEANLLEAFFWILCAYVVLVPTYQYFNTRKKKVQAKEWPPEDFGPVQRFAENRITVSTQPLPIYPVYPEVRPAGSRVHTSVADKKKKETPAPHKYHTTSSGNSFAMPEVSSFDFISSSSSYDSGSSSSDYSGGGGDSSGGGASGDW